MSTEDTKKVEKQKPVAEVVSMHGDPEAFGERRLSMIADIQTMPYGTKFYTTPQPCPECEKLKAEFGEALALPDLSNGILNRVRAEALEKAAIAVWNSAMKTCIDSKINPSERNDLFVACGVIRALAADMEAGKC